MGLFELETVTEKRCPECNLWRDLQEYDRDPERPDGLTRRCKTCLRAAEGMHLKGRARRARGIDSWEQLESVIRELAKGRYVLDREGRAYRAIVERARSEYADRTNEVCVHCNRLGAMLLAFLEANVEPGRRFQKTFRFGRFVYRDGEITFKFRAAEAALMENRP